MRRGIVTAVLAAGANYTIERGKIKVQKGRCVTELLFKLTATLTNASTTTNLTGAHIDSILDLINVNFDWGADGQHKPVQNLTLKDLRYLQEFAFGSGCDGDIAGTAIDFATAGNTSIANGAHTLTIWIGIPTGRLAFIEATRRLLGMGKTQSALCQVALERSSAAPSLASNVTMGTNITMELMPREEFCKGNPVCPLPEWHKKDEVDSICVLPVGLPYLVVERTHAQASNVSTSLNVDVGSLRVHERVAADEIREDYMDELVFPALSDPARFYTPVYMVKPESQLETLPAGPVRIEQVSKDLATFAAAAYYVPLYGDVQVHRDVKACAAAEKKTLRAVALVDVEGRNVPAYLRPYMPYLLSEPGEPEFDKMPGIVCGPNESDQPVIQIPATVAARAKAAHAQHKGGGEPRAADQVVYSIAASIPGGVQSFDGFASSESATAAYVRKQLGA